jgi:2,3-bisphosphoglycerate-dependent phosphoglycerate mutase
VLTYLVRHARTHYSVEYRVNGRRDVAVPLDQEGQSQCVSARAVLPVAGIATCVVSQFGRTAQTAELLLAGRVVTMVVDGRLDEIDYGEFEGGPFLEYGRWLRRSGPWQQPSGARESQREAIVRMIDGLRDVLTHPGPRLVIAHGLLVSVVNSTRTGKRLTGEFFPEAPYLAPVAFADDDLLSLSDRLIEEINTGRAGTCQLELGESVPTGGRALATFSAAELHKAEPFEDVDCHA